MQWKNITDLTQISEIKQKEGYSLIFKHSTRCSVSSMAKRRFELDWKYYLLIPHYIFWTWSAIAIFLQK